MKTVKFPCWTEFGKCDTVDWTIEVELTDEECALLESVLKKEHEEEFWKCKELADIYSKVYDIAVNVATEDALENDEDLQDEIDDDPDWRIDDLYTIGVEYPNL